MLALAVLFRRVPLLREVTRSSGEESRVDRQSNGPERDEKLSQELHGLVRSREVIHSRHKSDPPRELLSVIGGTGPGMDQTEPATTDTALPDGAIVDRYAWEEGLGALIVAAMLSEN
jgi:hypothetical protein